MAGSSQGTPGGGKSSGSQSQSLRPVTVAQILSANQPHADADFIIDGQQVGQLTFVGVVRSITTNPTNVIFHVDDGTGTAEVRVWLEAHSADEKHKDIKEWSYVRVIGAIKSFQSRRYIGTGHLRLVTDANEIFYHKLDAIHTHLLITKDAAGGAGAHARDGDGDDRMKIDGKRYEELENPIHRKIMQTVDALAQPGQDTGVPISAIARRIPNTNEATIR